MTTRNPRLNGLCRPDIEQLLLQGRARFHAALDSEPLRLEPGEVLIPMAEPHEYLYVVEQGWLARSRTIEDGRRQVIVIFLDGDTCGIKTLFLQRQPDAIEALTEAVVRRIHYRDTCTLAAEDFAISLHLAWQLADDERHLHNWNLRLGRGNAEERLAAFVLELRDRLASRGVDVSRGFALPITQQQIADHVGLTTVHVSRVLRRFRDLEMVSVQHRRVVFRDNFAALEALARPVQDLSAGNDGERTRATAGRRGSRFAAARKPVAAAPRPPAGHQR